MKIEGFFSNVKTANETINQLKNQGFNNATLDINDHYIYNRNIQTNLPGTSSGTSLSDLVLNSGADTLDISVAPLTAANPSVSGFGKIDEIADVNCKIVVEIEEKDEKKVKKVIKDMGGDLNNPNVNPIKMIAGADIVLENNIDTIRKNI